MSGKIAKHAAKLSKKIQNPLNRLKHTESLKTIIGKNSELIHLKEKSLNDHIFQNGKY